LIDMVQHKVRVFYHERGRTFGLRLRVMVVDDTRYCFHPDIQSESVFLRFQNLSVTNEIITNGNSLDGFHDGLDSFRINERNRKIKVDRIPSVRVNPEPGVRCRGFKIKAVFFPPAHLKRPGKFE